MQKIFVALVAFIPTFIVVMFIKQFSYGACLKSYCLEAALPQVFFFTIIITVLIAYHFNPISEKPNTPSKIRKISNQQPPNNPSEKKYLKGSLHKKYKRHSQNTINNEIPYKDFQFDTLKKHHKYQRSCLRSIE